MENIIKKTLVNQLKITGLFGNRDVSLSFSDGCRILIGENGLGKTTILSILNEVLCGNIENLVEFDFKELSISFLNSASDFNFHMDIIRGYAEARKRVAEDTSSDGLSKFETELFNQGFNDISADSIRDLLQSYPDIEKSLDAFMIDAPALLSSFIKDYFQIFKYRHELSRFNLKVLYLPTFRRVEADIKKILKRHSQKPLSNKTKLEGFFFNHLRTESEWYSFEQSSVIKFGMKDIDELIQSMLKRISNLSIKGYADVSGKMITQLLDSGQEDIGIHPIDAGQIKIILQRVGKSIGENERRLLIESLNEDALSRNTHLAYFLSSLSRVYKKTEVFDKSLKDFRDVCNEFLFDKMFHYDESHIKMGLYFKNDKNMKRQISLDKLSSGEKQLISLMAISYLQINKNLVFLMDEPELSLSIFWQKRLLPSIFNAKNCSLLVAATHSPFIFDNDLREFAQGPDEYVLFTES